MRKHHILAGVSLAAIVSAAGVALAADKYVVGVSNTLVGNGWREEMVCSIKAEALASGKVSKVILANRNGGPSEQIADSAQPDLGRRQHHHRQPVRPQSA